MVYLTNKIENQFSRTIILFSVFYLYNAYKKEDINLRIDEGTIRGYVSYEAEKPVNVFKVILFIHFEDDLLGYTIC